MFQGYTVSKQLIFSINIFNHNVTFPISNQIEKLHLFLKLIVISYLYIDVILDIIKYIHYCFAILKRLEEISIRCFDNKSGFSTQLYKW